MAPTEQDDAGKPSPWLFERTENKVWLVLFVAVGVAVGLATFPADWSLPAKALAGFGLGLGSMMSVFVPRMIGGLDFN